MCTCFCSYTNHVLQSSYPVLAIFPVGPQSTRLNCIYCARTTCAITHRWLCSSCWCAYILLLTFLAAKCFVTAWTDPQLPLHFLIDLINSRHCRWEGESMRIAMQCKAGRRGRDMANRHEHVLLLYSHSTIMPHAAVLHHALSWKKNTPNDHLALQIKFWGGHLSGLIMTTCSHAYSVMDS
jgi:hypothetical protein